MKVCRRLLVFHFELLFPYLFSFVKTSTGGVDLGSEVPFSAITRGHRHPRVMQLR
jgi:hypothetical protein